MEEPTRLYIGGLPYSLISDELTSIASEISPGSTGEIVIDRFSQRSKGFGFITAPTPSAAESLVSRLNGSFLLGRTVLVNYARPMGRRGRKATPPALDAGLVVPVADLVPSRALVAVVETVGQDLVDYFAMHPEEMKRMPHRKFEELVAAIWDRLGYKVELQQQTRDGGIDVIAVRRAEVNIRVLIQCKRPEPHKKVSVEAVRSLLGVKTDQGGSKAILVTTVTFTPDAQQLLDRHRWELEGRDYDGLLDWLHRTAR